MQTVTNDNFGPLIAYLVPGATVLLGFSLFSPTLQSWFATAATDAPSIGGFLYLTFASIAVGMTVSAVRWAVVDSLHAATGLRVPELNFSRLGDNVSAFGLLIEIHYRHYQFYSNMFVAFALAYVCYRVKLASLTHFGVHDLAFIILEVVFFAASRDTLRKYFTRSQQLLATNENYSPTQRDRGQPVTEPPGATCATEERFLADPQTQAASDPTLLAPSEVE